MCKKSLKITGIMFIIALIGVSSLGAQVSSLKGMSFNGATGLYSIPSARIGWEHSSNFGMDLGYHAMIDSGSSSHIPKMSLSLFNWVEIHGAFDIQPDGYITATNGSDFMAGAKIRFPVTNTALALGGNIQRLNIVNDNYAFNAQQIYLAVTYSGSFFDAPAETTVVLGKTFRENTSDTNLDFGMGFDLLLLPRHFGGVVHWITDFANFSYSVEAFGANAWNRGVLNTGVRLDLSVIPPFRRYKFVVDFLLTDAFDTNRAFSVGIVFGVPFV